ncbi:hypothetical protein [Maridesulfovibrio salexigens]|uniref:Lipoprotein n=1 Tax=Maridesulfovibrio salexigens (strain ATCC 14822 / DSM 2638 / NCIMB 8403 / VKM B-1763) TaxID=526222 RepID=C6BUA3_MARSD|nr:hypothetical protein [Maridesulfovibrio salexigens]ACS79912.1 hypothetical protein Desal_1851 [Maridesulfovibrio salexigens DSM 2638]
MKIFATLSVFLIALTGCSSWHNANYPDQAVAKVEFKKDRKECEKRTTEKLQIDNEDRSKTITTNSAQFSANYSRTKEFDKCMRIRGWVKR